MFVPLLIAGILTTLDTVKKERLANGHLSVTTYPLGIFFSFVGVGIASFMVKFVNDQEYSFSDIFSYGKDYVRIFLVNLLEIVYVCLYMLLFIVPGIIKAFGYAMVPLLLADEKYKNLGYRDLLKKSEEMMNGSKEDFFVLCFSFIGWDILGICTFGILFIWIMPYQSTAIYKFLSDLKKSKEAEISVA